MTIFEPISTQVSNPDLIHIPNLTNSVAGFTVAFIATEYFVAEQIPGSKTEAISDNTRMLALQ